MSDTETKEILKYINICMSVVGGEVVKSYYHGSGVGGGGGGWRAVSRCENAESHSI